MQLPELARVASIKERMGRVKASLRNCLDAVQWGGWVISKGCASCADGRGWRRFEGHRQLSGREIEKPTDPPSRHPSLWSGAHGYPRSTGWLRLPMVLLAWLLSVVPAQSQKPTTANLPTLTHVEQIREMTIEEAGRGYPVSIRGVVTYYNWDAGDLFIQDSTAGIWVSPGQTKLALHHGEFVEVEGFSGVGDLAPVIEHAHFRSLGEAPMPNPRRPTSDELASGKQDSQWIELQGVVRSVAEREGGLVLNLSSGAFECSVFVLKYPSLPTDIVDGQVRVRGVFGGLYDPSSVRFIGFHVLTPSWADVEVLERPTQRLSSVPVRPMRLFLRLTPEGAFTHRVHVRGVVTLQQLGRSLCIRDSEGALLVNTTQPTPLKVGDLIDATGYPAIGDYTVIMRDAIFQRVGAGPAPEPVAVSPEKLRAGNHNADLVRLSARLLNCTTRPGEEVLDLQAGGVTFGAVLNTRTSSSPLGSLRAGSLLQLTGVSMVEADKNHQAKGFEILLRFPADVVVLELPSWWTPGRALLVLSLLGVAMILALGWIAALRRRVRQQTETLRLKYAHELALEKQYRDLFENANDLIQWVDPQGRFVHVNPAWRKTLGYSEEEVANLSISDIIHPNCREHCLRLFERLGSGEKIERVEVEFVARSGETVVLEGSADCQFVDGKPGSTRGIFRNVTERKRAEELLQEGRKELQTIIDSVPALVFYKDKTNRLVRVNRPFSEAMGMPKKETENRTCSELWPETGEGYWSDDREVIESGRPKRNIIETVKTAQGTRWLQTDKIPHLDEGGNVVGIIGFAVDITDRKRAEAALIEERHLLHTLMDNLPDTIYFKDRESRFTRINKALAKAFGLKDPAQAVGKTDFDFFTDEHSQQAFADEREIIRTGQPMLAKEEKETWPDGHVTWVSTTKMPLRDTNGNIIGTFGVSRDITERRRAERVLEERTAYLNTLIEISPLGIITLDAQCRVQMCNPAFERLFLYRRAEIEGANLDELLAPPESVSEALELTAESLSGIAVHRTSRRRRKDGTLIHVEVHGVPLVMHGELVGQLGLYHDITERRRAEEALKESEERFRSLFENATVGIYRTTPEGRILMANPALVRMLGYGNFEELAARNLEDQGYEPSYPRQLFREQMDREGDIRGLDATWTKRDGSVIFLRESSRAIRGEHGEVLYYDGIVEDITERKRAEEALIEERHLLHTLMDNLPDVIYFKDRESHFTRINKAHAKAFGLKDPAQAVGKADFDFFTDEHAQQAYADEQEIIRTGQPVLSKEEKETWPDGHVTWASTTKMPLRDAQGQIVGTFGISRDVTERKRAEEALRESEEHFRRFIENVPLGVCRTTPDGRVLMANPALVRMLGYDSWQELASRNLEGEALEAGYCRSAFREQIEREGEVGGLEAAWKRRDGPVIFVRESARAFRTDDGRVLYYDCIVEDVTERRRLGEQLRQAQKMEAVGCLAGGVAHDFNNLLTVVIGYSDLLLKRVPARAGMRPPLEEIKKAAERAASLTRQLLAFSRKQMLQPQILDLNSLLTSVDEMLRRMIGEDIELATHLPSGLGRVKADPGQIEQVIMNLAVNARDAMPQGGRLTLEAANVELDSSYASSHESVLPGHYVMIAMSDTGIGMGAETQAHIFEPFFTTKELGKGTGLGLATVYGIVKQSGGSIRVYSEPGKGTTFKVYLPRIDQAVEVIAPTDVPVDELSRGSETILLAEDEEAVRSLVRGVLESTGYQVLETKGAHDALEVGERHRKHIHLLLTDVVMPQMSGAELVKHLAPLHPETKVLYMSGYTDHTVVRHGLLDPSTAFLQKPFTPDALALKVREVLDGAARQGT